MVFDKTADSPILNTLPVARLKLSDDENPTPEYQKILLSVAPLSKIPQPCAVMSEGEVTEPNSIFLSATLSVVELMVVNVP